MELHRLVADAEPRGDGLVRQSLREQLEHLNLARRQRLVERIVVVESLGVDGVRCDQHRVDIEVGSSGRRDRRKLCDDGHRAVHLRAQPIAIRGPSDENHTHSVGWTLADGHA